ncbi:MAG: hypothetical protein LBV23_00245, partial [Deltaproteobacteria bacterium]|nr:hypothetical protein [Deltaproteobacteria bacterium]
PPQALFATTVTAAIAEPNSASALTDAHIPPQPPVPAPNAPEPDARPLIYRPWEDLIPALELNANVKNVCSQNPDLVPIMIGAGRLALMPNCGGRLTPKIIQTLVLSGSKIFNKIQCGGFENLQPNQDPPAIGEDEISHLMWYLQAVASSKASISAGSSPSQPKQFLAGGMLIEDPEGRLKKFLDIANGYNRSSNHFTGFQTEAENRPRAIDVFSSHMPNSAASVLYQKLPDNATKSGAKMLYIKLEPFSHRGLSTKTTGISQLGLDHGRTRPATGFSGVLKRFFSNFMETLYRLFSYNYERNVIRAGTDNFEKVPSNVVSSYKNFVNQLVQRSEGFTQFNSIIAELNRVRVNSNTGGIHLALEALDKALRQTLDLPDDDGNKQRFFDRLTNFKNQLLSLVGDHPSLRFGREVILTNDELCPIDAFIPTTRENWIGNISAKYQVTARESKSIENYLNFALNGPQSFLTNELLTFQFDFARSNHLNLFDVPLAPGERGAVIYSTTTDSTPRNFQSRNKPTGAPTTVFLPQKVDAALAVFGGSQQFSDRIRSVLTQAIFADMRSIADCHLLIRAGLMNSQLLFKTKGLVFNLTRLTPRLAPNEPEPPFVDYALEGIEANFSSDPLPNSDGGDRFQGSATQSFTVNVRHNTATGEFTASQARVFLEYNLTRTLA